MSVHWIVIDDGLSVEDEEVGEEAEEAVEAIEEPEEIIDPTAETVPEITDEDIGMPTEVHVVISEPYRLPEGLVLIPEE